MLWRPRASIVRAPPCILYAHSLTLTRASARFAYARERERRGSDRDDDSFIVRTLTRLARVSRSLHAPVPIYVSACRAEPRQRSHAAKRGRIRAHDDSSDLETNDRQHQQWLRILPRRTEMVPFRRSARATYPSTSPSFLHRRRRKAEHNRTFPNLPEDERANFERSYATPDESRSRSMIKV